MLSVKDGTSSGETRGLTGVEWDRTGVSRTLLDTMNLDLFAAVALGLIPNAEVKHVHGYNPAVGAAEEALWNYGGSYTFPSAAAVIAVVSDSANDAAAGTGARTVTIEGLDANWAEIEETVTLDGVTPVNTVAQFLRVNSAYVATAGSGAANAGTISATISGGAVFGMPAGQNRTALGHYSVPAGKQALFHSAYFAMESGQSGVARIKIRHFGELMLTETNLVVGGWSPSHPVKPTLLPAKSDILLTATQKAGTAAVSGGFEMILFQT